MEDELVAAGRYARLETRGRVSGLPRVVTIGFVEEHDGTLLLAARAGAHWADNLLADPRCVVTVGERSWPAVAEELEGLEFGGRSGSTSSATARPPRCSATVRRSVPAGGGMTLKAELETRIGRSPAAVFAELIALDRYPQWLIATGVTRVEQLDPGHSRPARDCALISAWPAGRPRSRGRSRHSNLTAARAPGARPRGDQDRHRRLVAAEGPSTVLRWALRADLPLRYRMFEGMVAPQARRAAALDLEAFKRRLESVAED